MACLDQHRHHDGADVTQMPSDQHAHDFSPYSFGTAAAVLADLPLHAWRGHLRRSAEPPGHAALLDHVLEDFLVLQGVHRAPEALMLEGKQLIRLDQPAERRLDQFLAILEVVEDLGAEDEEAAIDPEIGILRWPEAD